MGGGQERGVHVRPTHFLMGVQCRRRARRARVWGMGAGGSKLETEHERVALKYKEVKRARTELQERLLKTTESSALSYETRLQSEISRLHDQHASDVDKCALQDVTRASGPYPFAFHCT